LLLWLLPLVAVVVGGGYVALLMRRLRARGVASASAAPAKTGGDEYLDRVEQDLKDY
jgi:cytochrome c-type biogenesis protein CcmH/NrfF